MTQINEIKNDDINRSAITSDYLNIAAGGTVNGWTVGLPVAATGPNNVATAGLQQIPQPDGKSVALQTAVRLCTKDGVGNIYHAFQAKAGQPYTFTWYDLGDYRTGDNVVQNPGYHVHITTVYPPVREKNGQHVYPFRATERRWTKRTLSVTPPTEGPWYISFEAVRDNNGIDRGPLVTLIKGYIGAEDDSDDTDVSYFRITGDRTLPLTKGSDPLLENAGRWHFSLQQKISEVWQAPSGARTLRFLSDDADSLTFSGRSHWDKFLDKGTAEFYLPANAVQASVPAQDETRYIRAGFWSEAQGAFNQIKLVGYDDGGFVRYPPGDGTIPLSLKVSGAATWTIKGVMPDTVSAKKDVSLQLLKNGKALTAPENLTFSLDTDSWLEVQPPSVTTGTDGKFTLTLTPKAGQTGTHTTILTLHHQGQAVQPPYTITTSAPVSAKYDIRVYAEKDAPQPLNLHNSLAWGQGEGNYLYVSVVKHGTDQEVEQAEVTVELSPADVLTAIKNKAEFTPGHRARFDFNPVNNRSGKVSLIFKTAGADRATLTVMVGRAGGSLNVVRGRKLVLTPGIKRTLPGDSAPLDIRFNPPYEGGHPPDISFSIDGHGFHILANNIPSTAGKLTPEDPSATGDYRIQPQLTTDASASKSGNITFYIDREAYPDAAAQYKEAVVEVDFSIVDHVTWSVAGNTPVDAGSTTLLKTGLKAFSAENKELSAYMLNVSIVSEDKAGASFVSGPPTLCPLTGADTSGWAHLPEMQVKQDTGEFQLQASQPDAGAPLNEKLTLKVKVGQPATEIIMHAPGVDADGRLPITWADYNGLYTHDASRYAQLNDAGHQPVHSGRVKFTIEDSGNTARAKMTVPDDAGLPGVKTVGVNSNGHAIWPDITIASTSGEFTLTASSDGIAVSPKITFRVS